MRQVYAERKFLIAGLVCTKLDGIKNDIVRIKQLLRCRGKWVTEINAEGEGFICQVEDERHSIIIRRADRGIRIEEVQSGVQFRSFCVRARV